MMITATVERLLTDWVRRAVFENPYPPDLQSALWLSGGDIIMDASGEQDSASILANDGRRYLIQVVEVVAEEAR